VNNLSWAFGSRSAFQNDHAVHRTAGKPLPPASDGETAHRAFFDALKRHRRALVSAVSVLALTRRSPTNHYRQTFDNSAANGLRVPSH